MSNAVYRRELRRKKILENSEERLKRLTLGLNERNVEKVAVNEVRQDEAKSIVCDDVPRLSTLQHECEAIDKTQPRNRPCDINDSTTFYERVDKVSNNFKKPPERIDTSELSSALKETSNAKGLRLARLSDKNYLRFPRSLIYAALAIVARVVAYWEITLPSQCFPLSICALEVGILSVSEYYALPQERQLHWMIQLLFLLFGIHNLKSIKIIQALIVNVMECICVYFFAFFVCHLGITLML